MTDRKTLQIREPTGSRFERAMRDGETQTEALRRLLDEAGVPRQLRCSECGDVVADHVRDDDGGIYCFGCCDLPETATA